LLNIQHDAGHAGASGRGRVVLLRAASATPRVQLRSKLKSILLEYDLATGELGLLTLTHLLGVIYCEYRYR